MLAARSARAKEACWHSVVRQEVQKNRSPQEVQALHNDYRTEHRLSVMLFHNAYKVLPRNLSCFRSFSQNGARMPLYFSQGRNGPSLSGGLGAGDRLCFSKLVRIAICSMKRGTETSSNPSDSARPDVQIKVARRSYQNPTRIATGFLARENHCSRYVPGLEPMMELAAAAMAGGKPRIGTPPHLSLAMSSCLNQPRHHLSLRGKDQRSGRSDTHRIPVMLRPRRSAARLRTAATIS